VGFLGTPNPNYAPKKSVYWYTKACINNHAEAFNNLAFHYEIGKGCQQDLNKALELYKKSAELGYSIGKHNYKKMLRDLIEGRLYNK
jgi:TPR repeat protein